MNGRQHQWKTISMEDDIREPLEEADDISLPLAQLSSAPACYYIIIIIHSICALIECASTEAPSGNRLTTTLV